MLKQIVRRLSSSLQRLQIQSRADDIAIEPVLQTSLGDLRRANLRRRTDLLVELERRTTSTDAEQGANLPSPATSGHVRSPFAHRR